DQRGVPRPQGAGVDIGAFELQLNAPPQPQADLAVAVLPDHQTVTLGQGDVAFMVFVANKGPDTATGITLTDTLPAGTTLVFVTGGVTPVNGVLTFHLSDLAKDQITSVTIVVRPTAAGTLHDAAAVSGGLTDPDGSNNSSAADATVV